jgi:hypothetical protein
MNGARPLEPGQHAVGVTLGGAVLEFAGAPLPLPNAVVEARHGVALVADRPLDLSYGLNLTPLAFGLVQGHVGSSWLLFDQRGAAPALSVTDRVFFALDPAPQGWGANQLELTASWRSGHQLVYLSLSQYLDLLRPSLVLTPALGAALDPGPAGGFFVQPELRYYGVNLVNELNTIPWMPDRVGAVGFSVGVGSTFGGAR